MPPNRTGVVLMPTHQRRAANTPMRYRNPTRADSPLVVAATEIHAMSKTKPGGKSGPRAQKVDPPRSQKPVQAPNLAPAQQPPIETAIASLAIPASLATPASPAVPVSPAVPASPKAFSVRAAAPANTPSIDFQTIATVYGDYTKKSFEQTKAFVEKLSGVRSLDQAIEIQTEFAKQAYETFVTESQKICELYSGLARQGLEGAIATVIPAAR